MLRTVVLGAGHWHLPLYRDAFLKHHQIIGVWDTDPDAAARAAADLGTIAHDTVADCLAAKPDLAYVLGRARPMPDICRQLIAARIPFVLEKPGAAAVADLAAVGDEADAAGVPATVALVQRYGPLPDLLVASGDLRHVRFSFVAGPPSRYIDAGCGWVLDRSVSGGGCLYLLGVHFTDMLRHVTGQADHRSPVGAPVPRRAPSTEDYGVLNTGNRRRNDRHRRDRLDLPGRPRSSGTSTTPPSAPAGTSPSTPPAESNSVPPARTPSTRPSTSTATPSTRSSSLKSPRTTTPVSLACPP